MPSREGEPPARTPAQLQVDREALESESGDVWFADPNRTRYFYGPSALMLRKGQAYFSQKELFYSAIGVGITDNFSFLVGTVAPLWLMGGFNGVLGLKAGGPITETLHLSAAIESGALYLDLRGLGVIAIAGGSLVGSATYAHVDRHLTISLSKPFITNLSHSNGRAPTNGVATLSGSVRVARNVALITENWMVVNDFSSGEFLTAYAFGARFMGATIAADVGFIWAIDGCGGRQPILVSAIPVPWVDFTWNFALGGG